MRYDAEKKKLLETPCLPGQKPKKQSKSTSPQLETKPDPTQRPYSPTQLQERIEASARTHKSAGRTPTGADRKIVASHINNIFAGDKTKRYEFCKWAVGAASTKEMGGEYILALKTWMDVDGWNDPASELSIKEAQSALVVALKEAGQKELI